jgi:hypothetical protein
MSIGTEHLLNQLPDQGMQTESGVSGLQFEHHGGITFFVTKVVLPERQTGRCSMP